MRSLILSLSSTWLMTIALSCASAAHAAEAHAPSAEPPDRFVRCFITKLLTYANGEAPAERDFVEVDRILSKSVANGHRTVNTIAAVIEQPRSPRLRRAHPRAAAASFAGTPEMLWTEQIRPCS